MCVKTQIEWTERLYTIDTNTENVACICKIEFAQQPESEIYTELVPEREREKEYLLAVVIYLEI